MSLKEMGGVSRPIAHDSAVRHVTGRAVYTDDIPEPRNLLHAALCLSDKAHARIVRIRTEGALQLAGVHAVLLASDIPGINEVGPIFPGETILADSVVQYHGEPVAAVVAETLEIARKAAGLIEVDYEELEAVLDIEAALEKDLKVASEHTLKIGDSEAVLKKSPRRLQGRLRIGGQDHFYLEGQIAVAIPKEDGDIEIHSSTQHPSEVQKMTAQALGVMRNAVTVQVRRMGGGFGGKETQPAILACIAALLSRKTARAVKLRLNRDDDMIMTGKRHHFLTDYDVGFDHEGRLQALSMQLAAGCGQVADLSTSILDRALFHSDNAYVLPHATLHGIPCKTHTVSNTAFRGFGGPQGMLGIEEVMDNIARELDLDPLLVRRRNYYPENEALPTPYHQPVEDSILHFLTDELMESSDYHQRREAVRTFNSQNPWVKRGLAFSPVKFGISFTTKFLNQAGALLHIYADGSIHLNHGGTEMGQGLFTKVAQIVAEEFAVSLDQVKITATHTGKVPNTSATAASSGTDLNGKAAQAAAKTIKKRLIDFAAEKYQVSPESIRFHDNRVSIGERRISFAELINQAHHERVSLSTTGFYATPKIWYDRGKSMGRPFLYFAYGAAVSEVELDVFSGEYRFLRTDILHDVGNSINPAIDRGQIEGGYIQGVGWLTMEELFWSEQGALKTHAPSTYKIPTIRDIPQDFRVRILENSPNQEETIHRSKAVGEPPLMLGISTWLALKDAVSAAANFQGPFDFEAPATPEKVLLKIQALKDSS